MLLIMANGINKPRACSATGQLCGFIAHRGQPQLDKISIGDATSGQRINTNFCAKSFYICLVKPTLPVSLYPSRKM